MIAILQSWLGANYPLIYFVYGLVFFVLGLSIALQSRQYSRLRLAQSLSWLAGFGILHGLNEWADVFIPIQTEFLSDQIAIILHSIHYIVLALSFACLLQFGIDLFRPFTARFRWIRFLSAGIFIIWLIFPYILGFQTIPDFDRWGSLVTSTARYFIGFPGAILSGLGLLHQSKSQLEPMSVPDIRKTLKIASVSLFAYAIFSGLIVNPSFYFPATVINSDTFTSLFLVPPAVFRTIIGMILAAAIIRALEVFNIETDRLIWSMEQEQVIANERERIARDLHDGALQQIYAAGLLAQSLRKKVDGALRPDLDRLISIINNSIDQLRSFLPLSVPNSVSIDLFSALSPVIEKARSAVTIVTHNELASPLYLQPDQVSHVIAFVSETLSNALRHSQTKRIEIGLSYREGILQLTVQDHGQGLPNGIEPGYGLRTMHDRARLLDAELILVSEPGKGLKVKLNVPVERLNEPNPSINRR